MEQQNSLQGRVWDSWELGEIIGRGNFGVVYKAKRSEYNMTFYAAIKHMSIPMSREERQKLLAEGLFTDAASEKKYYDRILEGLLKEIDLCNELKGHTNIVSYEDHKVIPKASGIGYDVFIRMELLTPLTEVVRTRALTEGVILKIGKDMCNALTVLAQHGIIHKDIKPSNILCSKDRNYKLGDFGISEYMHFEGRPQLITGTVNYMAPEVYHRVNTGLASDQYSLGLVLYWLCNGYTLPWAQPSGRTTTEEAAFRANQGRFSGQPIPGPRNASPELGNIIMRACQFDPAQRWQSPGEMARALENCGRQERDPVLKGEDEEDGESSVGYKILLILLCAVIALMLLAVGLFCIYAFS